MDIWWQTYQGRPAGVSELVKICANNDLLTPVLGGGTDRSQAIRLGNALKNARDRVYGEHRICHVRDRHSKQNEYFIQRMEPAR